MKRTLLGVAALLGVVGLGSAGVWYVQHAYTSSAPPQGEPEQGSATSARDLPLTPIPLAAPNQDAASSQSDRVGRSERARRVVVAEDRYTDSRRQRLADDEPTASEIPNANEIPARDEAVPAPQGGDPFGSHERSAPAPRFAEQPTAAEVPAQEEVDHSPSDAPADTREPEPRRLEAPAALAPVDRYGRAIAGARNSRDQQEPGGAPAENQPALGLQQEATDGPAVAVPADNSASADEGTGRPGDPQLSGSQAPTLTIEKMAPSEIQIGKPARFVIKVRNAGSVVAHGVEIHDTVPQGTQLIDTTPPAKRGPQGVLVWDLGSLKPGEEQKAELQLMPTAEGEIGSVATVHFHAQASVRTVSTKPMLNIEVSAPAKVMKGAPVTLKIKLSNPGTGAASGIVLSEQVPAGLSHASGKELELEVGTLKPGESREVDLGLVAAAAGPVTNIVLAQAEGNLRAEARADLEVIAPGLQVSMSGPKRRYLERNATHNISISNPGTAAAKNIELVAVLPKELKFIEANNGGQFDAAKHSVYWSLEELPPQETGTVTLTTLPLEAGDAKVLIQCAAQAGLKDQREEVVAIEGLAAVNFQLADLNGPIEVNGQATYKVHVTNQGSKAATNVRLAALLPREMKAVAADGPVRYKIEGQRVVFEPLKQLAPKADATYSIKAQALAAGDLRVQVQLATDENREPITKEESTRVYGDE